MIALNNITVDFDGFLACDDVSLHVEKNDIYGIVGFSGAGKSTLVRTINLLQRPSAGSVIVKGENLLDLSKKDLRAKRKNIGMIFQHFNLLNNITILDNVIYPIRKLKIPKEERSKKPESFWKSLV